MKSVWESKLKQYFEENLRLDKEAEEIRRRLSKSCSIQSLFNTLDSNSNNTLTIKELISYLTHFNQLFNYDHLRRVIQWYDKDGDMALNYNDFLSFVLPHDDNDNKQTCNQLNKDYQPNQINHDLFIDLINQELEIAMRLGEIVEEIKESKSFLTYDAFVLIVGEEKYINQRNLSKYLTSQGLSFDNNEIRLIIYRYDNDIDGNISYVEFKNIFFPYVNDTDVYQPFETEIKMKPINDNAEANEQRDFLHFDYSMNNELEHLNLSNYHIKDHNINSQTRVSKHNGYGYTEAKSSSNYNLHKKNNHSLYDIPVQTTINNSFHSHSCYSPNKSQCLHIARFDINNEANKSYFNSSPGKDFSIPTKNQSQLKQSKANIPVMKSRQERKKYFIDLIKEILKQERICESIKEKISRDQSMSLPDIFSYFDYSNRDHISMSDLYEVLQNIGAMISLDDIELLFKRYDTDYDRHLDYTEFCKMILNRKIEYARMLSNHQPSKDFIQFSVSSIKLIGELFVALLTCEKCSEEKRRVMNSYPGYSHYEMFEMIKAKYTDIIYKSDLINFLRNNDIITTPFDELILMDYFDKDQNGQISFNSFIKGLIHKS